MEQVWGVCLAKNESDIIGYTISHMVAEGVDGFVIEDNGSSDNTPDVLEKIRDTLKLPVILIKDPPSSAYCQAERMTNLSKIASSNGASWIIPFDADELWCHQSGRITDVLRMSNVRHTKAIQFYYYCTRQDNINQANPYKRIQFRTSKPRPWSKVCFRWWDGAALGGGNHTLYDSNGKDVLHEGHTGIQIMHFPCRGFDQMVNKVIRHGIGMDLQYPNDKSWKGDGPQLHFLYRLYQSKGISALARIWESGDSRSDPSGFIMVSNPSRFDLVNDPAPYKGAL